MKFRFLFIILTFLLLNNTLYAQSASSYANLVTQAYTLYHSRQFRASAVNFTTAFKKWPKNIKNTDVYNAACSWALTGNIDSGFLYLNLAVKKYQYNDLLHLKTDEDLNSLHQDKRWPGILTLVQRNQNKKEAKLNKPLMRSLDTIYTKDQEYRSMIDSVETKYGIQSPEKIALFKKMVRNDSLNLLQVRKMISSYGWLGDDIVGEQGNTTVWLVVQHADLKTQLKYLPLLRRSVKKGKSKPYHLALMEDRVLVYQGKKQIYGSQYQEDKITGKVSICPIQDEHFVDERRKSVGLPPLEDDAKVYGIDYKLP